MGRKKARAVKSTRQPERTPRHEPETAVVAKADVASATAVQAPPTPTVEPAPRIPPVKTEPKVNVQHSIWEIAIIRMARSLGSLQVAVVGLSLFVLVLAIGTMVESWYTGKIAQELIYRTWWFAGLLGVLWINIFFAAAKKWPWKKQQTGFIVTHIGLLTMVFGGILCALGGTDAVMVVTDTDNPSQQRQAGGPQTSGSIFDRDRFLIRVKQADAKTKAEAQTFTFDPGSLTWRADKHTDAQVPTLLQVLHWLAHPLPHHWTVDLGDQTRLEILAFYPHCRTEDYSPWSAEDNEAAFPAVKFKLDSAIAPMASRLPEQWVADRRGSLEDKWRLLPGGAGMIEMIGHCPSEAILKEFMNPPKTSGKKGTLVLFLNGQRLALDVDQVVGAVPFTDGWKVELTKYRPDLTKMDDPDAAPAYPFVEFNLTNDAGTKGEYGILSRFPTLPRPVGESAPRGLRGLEAYYHPADPRFEMKDDVRAVLQFATGPDSKLYYRSYSSSRTGGAAQFGFENSGAADQLKAPYPIWQGMKWSFEVRDYLPRASTRPRYVPENHRPGLERGDLIPAVRCQLTTPSGSKEFWVPLSDTQSVPVEVGKQVFNLGFNYKMEQLPFEIKLLRGEETFDPGTQQKASYSSYVQLTDKEKGILHEDRLITMNEPLEHRGFKFYQSGMEPTPVIDQNSQRQVHRSTFTVGRDPGLWLKYLGSIMLALGIVLMFYMKAYFFKPRARRETPAGANGATA